MLAVENARSAAIKSSTAAVVAFVPDGTVLGEAVGAHALASAISTGIRAREGDVIGKQIISAKTAKTMSRMLETVTEVGGTATKGQVPGYRVAGKTGTAHKLLNGQYAEHLYVSSFVGYGPALNPRYIIAVLIDEPGAGKHFGGDVSAPVFSNVMSQALRMSGVPPDAPQLREASAAPMMNAKERG